MQQSPKTQMWMSLAWAHGITWTQLLLRSRSLALLHCLLTVQQILQLCILGPPLGIMFLCWLGLEIPKRHPGKAAIAQIITLQLLHSQRSERAVSLRAVLWYTADSDKLHIGTGRMDGDLATCHSVLLNPSSHVLQMQEGPLMYVFRRATMKKLLKCL